MSATSPASADEGSAEHITLTMHLVSFDEEVAAANGYEIRTTESGRQFSVPIGTAADYQPALEDTVSAPAAPGTITPMATSHGNCGTSSVDVDDEFFSTGYNVTNNVVISKWGVTIHTASFNEDINLDHGSTGPSWEYVGVVGNEHTGTGYAKVNGGSTAILVDGKVCTSGEPQQFWTW